MSLYIGVDGGATKTRTVVTMADGTIVGEGRAGASNYQIVGVDAAAQHLAQSLLSALDMAGASNTPVAGIAAGFAGLDSPADQEAVAYVLTGGLAEAGLSAPWWLLNDAVTAWAGALGGAAGAIIISGSGAAAFAVNRAGGWANADGWGHWLGDEGSGFDIGQQGLRAAARADDGRGPATELLNRLARRHGSDNGWKHWVASLNAATSDQAHAQIASFAPEVVQAAAKGDAQARKILFRAGNALAQTAASALRKVGFVQEPSVATVGSLLAHSLILRDYFIEALIELIPSASVQWPNAQPAEGAALLARRPHLVPEGVLCVVGNR